MTNSPMRFTRHVAAPSHAAVRFHPSSAEATLPSQEIASRGAHDAHTPNDGNAFPELFKTNLRRARSFRSFDAPAAIPPPLIPIDCAPAGLAPRRRPVARVAHAAIDVFRSAHGASRPSHVNAVDAAPGCRAARCCSAVRRAHSGGLRPLLPRSARDGCAACGAACAHLLRARATDWRISTCGGALLRPVVATACRFHAAPAACAARCRSRFARRRGAPATTMQRGARRAPPRAVTASSAQQQRGAADLHDGRAAGPSIAHVRRQP